MENGQGANQKETTQLRIDVKDALMPRIVKVGFQDKKEGATLITEVSTSQVINEDSVEEIDLTSIR